MSEPETVGFHARVVEGREIYLIHDDQIVRQPITRFDALQLGTRVAVPHVFKWANATVTEVTSPDSATAISGGVGFFLSFDQDDRHCWACTAVYDRKVIDQIQF